MITTQIYNAYDLKDLFKSFDRDDYTMFFYESVFNYFEEYSEETGTDYKIDVIELCCNISEYTYKDIKNEFDNCKNMNNDEIIEYLQENTTVIGCNEEIVIFQAF